jgi:hypothetical protein
MDLFSKNATVVLVHGAWAHGSSWNRVILPLLHQGLKVICAPIPLTSLSDDAPHSIVLSREPTARFCLLGTPNLAL